MGAQAEQKAAMDRYKKNAENARQAAVEKWSSLQNKAAQVGAQSVQQGFEKNISGAKASATAIVAAATGGLSSSGLSVAQFQRSIEAQRGRSIAASASNLDDQFNYLKGEMRAESINTQNRINSVGKPVNNTALNFASMLTGIYGGVSKYQTSKIG